MMVQILMKIVLICLRGCNSALIRLQRKVFTNDYPNCRHLLSSHVTVINSQRPFIKLKITTLSWQGLAQISRLCQNCLKNLPMAKRNKISRTRAMRSCQVLNGNRRPSSAVLMSPLPIRLVQITSNKQHKAEQRCTRLEIHGIQHRREALIERSRSFRDMLPSNQNSVTKKTPTALPMPCWHSLPRTIHLAYS